MSSLQGRLRSGLGLSLVIVLFCLWWFVGKAIEDFGEGFVRSRLAHDADTLISALTVGPDGRAGVEPGRMASIYRTPFSGHYYAVLAGGRFLYSRSLWDQRLAVSPLPPGGERQWTASGPMGQPLLVWSVGLRKQGRDYTLAVAEDLTQLSKSLAVFNWSFAGLALLTLVVLLTIQQLIVTRSLRPLDRIRDEVRRLQQGAVGGLSEDVPDEVRPLVHEINHLLSLLDERLQRSRHALGNLAHALKGPLSLLGQLARHEHVRREPALAEELERHTRTIRQLMERELKRARIMGHGTPGARFIPAQELPILVDAVQRMNPGRAGQEGASVEIDWQAPDTAFVFDRDDMLELIGNLLDNAAKWARRRVVCRLQGEARRLEIVVEDDGPGCSEEEIARLTERGVRIDEAVPGHGLGLAIVRDIVETYEGTLEITRSPTMGGLRVRIMLGNADGD